MAFLCVKAASYWTTSQAIGFIVTQSTEGTDLENNLICP